MRPALKLLLPVLILSFLYESTASDFLTILGGGDGIGGPSKRMVINRIGQCPGQKDLPIYFDDFKITQYNKTNYVVNGEVTFREDFPKGWTGSAVVKKCDDFSSAANCRPFLNNIASTDLCTLLNIPNAMYMKYLNRMTPIPRCPFKKGTYVVKDQLVEDELTRFLPGSGNTYWEARSTGKIGDRMVMCFIIQVNVRPKRSKTS
ncbi:uncharacterized protein LOC134209133 [Armigeres subalbatus]|uniref:uncharacterized protein LOC134209133 n=1 Tax=Armigeres subalbatus TaxID=124917 RepID=UPI002ED0565C